MVRDACESGFLSAADVAGGKGYVKEFGECTSVFVEAFVEVAHAEQEERIGVFCFELEVLATARG